MVLRATPRPASWHSKTHTDQIRLRAYLDDAEDQLAPFMVRELWVLRLDMGIAKGRDLLDMADLDNYAYPLASRLRDERLVSVWCTKGFADTSRVRIAPAREQSPPDVVISASTTRSAQTTAYKEEVRAALAGAAEIAEGAVHLQVSFTVGPRRNWLNLWKPTIDALDPLLGRTQVDRDWHPRDGRITELGLHLTVNPAFGDDTLVSIAASRAHRHLEAPSQQ